MDETRGLTRVVSYSAMYGAFQYDGEVVMDLFSSVAGFLTDWIGDPPTTDAPAIPSAPNIKCAFGWVTTGISEGSNSTVNLSGLYYAGDSDDPTDIGSATSFVTSQVCSGECYLRGEILTLPPRSNLALYVAGTHRIVIGGDQVVTHETSGGITTKDGEYIAFAP